jgi:apolipoprotein D and lipocalin family protein
MWVGLALGGLTVLSGGCVSFGPPLAVVDGVEVERYMGTWYEIARYPNFFQGPECVGTTAEYTLRDDGRVRVVNRCRENTLDGPERSIEGVARVVDAETNAKLKVSFFGPFEGNYWIIDLDADYQWAVVGEPSRRYLWILSRTPSLDEAIYAQIISSLPEKEYDPDTLVRTLQDTE